MAALVAEARCLTGRRIAPDTFVEQGPLLVVACGMGPQRAGRAAEIAIRNGARALVSWGTAGALVPELAPGTPVIPPWVAVCGGRLPVDAPWHERLHRRLAARGPVRADPLAHSDRPVCTPAARGCLARTTQAVAVDMESGAVARVAAEHALPFVAVRVVADPWHLALPAAVSAGIDAWGRPRPAALAAALARAPRETLALWRLRNAFHHALARLEDIGRVTGVDLGFAR